MNRGLSPPTKVNEYSLPETANSTDGVVEKIRTTPQESEQFRMKKTFGIFFI